jgi:hypothetical protein
MAMLQHYPQYVQAIFLHVVSMDEHAIQTNTVPIPRTKYINGRPILYFRTYMGAALLAYEHGLISWYGLHHMVNTISSVLQASSSSSSSNQLTKDQRYDLEYDLQRAKQVLQPIL